MDFEKQKIKKFARESLIPIILIVIYLFLFKFQSLVDLPTEEKILELTLEFINNQSILVIFLIALIEGGLFLGQYAPGGLVIFLSIISAGNDILEITILITVITIAFLLAYTIDYLIGYYGLNFIINKAGFHDFIERSKRTVNKSLPSAIFFSFWDTNIASLTSVASGLMRIQFRKFFFYAVIFTIFWNIFWAVLLFLYGRSILSLFGTNYILLVLIVWIAYLFYKNFIQKEDSINF